MTEPDGTPRLRDRASSAFGWVAAGRLFSRLLGIVRIVVLARFLAPDDFGQFGVAVLVLTAVEQLSRPGLTVALVQRAGKVERYLDAVWSALLVRSAVVAVALWAARGVAADFFEIPEAASLIAWVALATGISGFTSVGFHLLQRELRLNRRFMVVGVASVADLVVAVPLAVWWRDPVALALGMVARNVALVVASWIAHPYKPSFTLRWGPLRELQSFAVHTGLHTAIFFFVEQSDDAFVGKLLGDSALGLYVLAYRIAGIVTQDFSKILSEITLPVLSRVQSEPHNVIPGVREATGATAAVVMPLAALLLVTAEPALLLLLGDGWSGAVPVFRVLLVFGLFRALSQSMESGLTALDEVGFMTRMLVVQALVMVGLLFLLGLRFGLVGVGVAVLVSQMISFMLSSRKLASALECATGRLISGVRYPLLGALTAGGAAWAALQLPGATAHPVLAVATATVAFAPVFLLTALRGIRTDLPNLWGMLTGRLERLRARLGGGAS